MIRKMVKNELEKVAKYTYKLNCLYVLTEIT